MVIKLNFCDYYKTIRSKYEGTLKLVHVVNGTSHTVCMWTIIEMWPSQYLSRIMQQTDLHVTHKNTGRISARMEWLLDICKGSEILNLLLDIAEHANTKSLCH